MKCPTCNIDLQMTERQGIEIDYCSQCRGVWLDRGELDKIIEKSNVLGERPASLQYSQEPQRQDYYGSNQDQGGNYYKKKHKKESLLGELFDF